MREVVPQLWQLAVENVTERQEEVFDPLFTHAVKEHLKGDCPDCTEELCSECEEEITTRIEKWQDERFYDQTEAEYERLEEQVEEWELAVENVTRKKNAAPPPI